MSILAEFVKARLYPPADSKLSFVGKTVLITGANTGVGYAAALKFAQLGASRLILGVRSLKKGEDARNRIEAAAGSPPKGRDATSIEVWDLDMLSYPSIQAFATRAEKEIPSLEYAVLNAGVSSASFGQSDYGWEKTIQVNTLSTTLLALLLLPQLRKANTADFTPVLEIVSSGGAYYFSRLKGDTGAGYLQPYNEAQTWDSMTAYMISKVFLEFAKVGIASTVQHGNAEAKDASGPDVFVISVCPGPTKSDLARDQTAWWARPILAILSFVQRSSEQGSRSYISGLMQGQKGHGGFWQNDRLREPAPLLLADKDKKLQAKIWAEVVGALEKDVPEVRKLVEG